jgi:hypothetical protein
MLAGISTIAVEKPVVELDFRATGAAPAGLHRNAAEAPHDCRGGELRADVDAHG